MTTYDAIVVGAGSAGNPLARRLAKEGWKVAIVERAYVGGTCTNYGCTPTKTMIASAKAAFEARQTEEFGVVVGEVVVDLQKVVARKNSIVEKARKGTEKSLQIPNLDLIRGEASFISHKKILVAQDDGAKLEITAEKIFLDTGTSPSLPDIPGLQDVAFLNSTSIMELTEIPDHLLIIGGSYIALEFGQMFRRFGSKVCILTSEKHFLSKEDKDVADELCEILRDEDIEIIVDSEVTGINSDSVTEITVSYKKDGKMGKMTGSHLLIATGRKPNTPALKLGNTGLATDETGYIPVNERLETAVEGIYALGDVKGGPGFTHVAYNDYLIVRKNILDGENVSTKSRNIPYVMYTDPQLGRIGITEVEAKEQKLKIKVGKLKMTHCARGIETGESRGFMKVIVDAKTHKILGAAMLMAEGGELMSLLQVAMEAGMQWQQLRDMMFAHPTYSESLINLFLEME